MTTRYRRMATFRTAADLRAHLADLGVELPLDDALDAGPLSASLDVAGRTIGNRFAVLPMEGWDGTPDGAPSDLTVRRWERFGISGAKLIWGGEAVAVRHDGRANPNQLCLTPRTAGAIGKLRKALVAAHRIEHGTTDDLLVGLQLTHSGRFSRPDPSGRPQPRILYRHQMLDGRFDLAPDLPVLSDDEIGELEDAYVAAARRARDLGFTFVDIKHCHGYLGHEFLSAFTRPGRYGGSFENRTRFLREVIGRITTEVPGLAVGVRLSSFDLRPFRADADGVGRPEGNPTSPYGQAFGGSADGLRPDPQLAEAKAVLDLLSGCGVQLVCVSAASPYYNPHLMRPAAFPPSDGYLPPEDPLVGVARLIHAAAELKRHRPEMVVVGSGYSYLQEWLPHVAQRVVADGMADVVGLGRTMLSYPQLPADVLSGRGVSRRHVCRTFSDCTTAPRNGMVSGCYPLDLYYKEREEAERVRTIKQALKQ